jgi:hypothetical protein
MEIKNIIGYRITYRKIVLREYVFLEKRGQDVIDHFHELCERDLDEIQRLLIQKGDYKVSTLLAPKGESSFFEERK